MSDPVEQLVARVKQIDPKADWIYNKYCGYCGKFLYPDELGGGRCKKCRTPVSRCINRVLPFMTSGTAIEKLLMWARTVIISEHKDNIANIIYGWMMSDSPLETLHSDIIAGVIAALNIAPLNADSGFESSDSGH